VREFKESHGLEAHDLAEDGERWLTHRTSYLTRFGASCATLDEVGSARGRRLEFTVSVPSVSKVARDWAVDSFTWAREMEMPFRVLPLRTLQEYSPGPALLA